MTDKLLAWCQEQQLFCPGDRVTVAVSGGADSMAMLHFLWHHRSVWDLTITCAHFNHQLRGAESDRDEAFVRAVCAEQSIAFVCGSQDVAAYAKKTGQGLEAAARTLRYEFLQSVDPKAKLATAHTASDNLETVLMHLVRGASLQGLCGIAPKRNNIVRPMLALTRQDIVRYVQRHGVGFVTDSSNLEDFCLRNRLRSHVIPHLLEENPNVQSLVLGQSLRLREDAQLLSQTAQELLPRPNAPVQGKMRWPSRRFRPSLRPFCGGFWLCGSRVKVCRAWARRTWTRWRSWSLPAPRAGNARFQAAAWCANTAHCCTAGKRRAGRMVPSPFRFQAIPLFPAPGGGCTVRWKKRARAL